MTTIGLKMGETLEDSGECDLEHEIDPQTGAVNLDAVFSRHGDLTLARNADDVLRVMLLHMAARWATQRTIGTSISITWARCQADGSAMHIPVAPISQALGVQLPRIGPVAMMEQLASSILRRSLQRSAVAHRAIAITAIGPAKMKDGRKGLLCQHEHIVSGNESHFSEGIIDGEGDDDVRFNALGPWTRITRAELPDNAQFMVNILPAECFGLNSPGGDA